MNPPRRKRLRPMTTQGRTRSGYSAWRLIAEELRREIVTGSKPPGTKLPAEGELAERFGVHRNTVRQAVAALAAEHLVVSRRGSGTFVAEHTVLVHRIGARTRLSDSLGRRGRASGRLLESAVDPAPPADVARAAGPRRAPGPAARDRACRRRTPAVPRHALVRGRPRARARAALRPVRVDHLRPAGERDRRLRARLDHGRRAARHGGRVGRARAAARLGRAGHALPRHPHRRHAAAGRHHPVRGRRVELDVAHPDGGWDERRYRLARRSAQAPDDGPPHRLHRGGTAVADRIGGLAP